MADRPRAPHPVDVAVGHAVRARRLSIGVSQEALAEAAGVSFQQIQKYESGANRISCSRLVQIAGALACAPAELLPNGPSGELSERTEELSFFAHPGARQLARQFMALDGVRQRSVRNIVEAVASTMDDGEEPSAAYVTGGDMEASAHVPA